MTESDPDDERMMAMFTVLRDHVVQIVSDLADRVRTGIIAEDDGRFGAPSLREILSDLTGNASGVITDLTGSGPTEDDPDGEPG